VAARLDTVAIAGRWMHAGGAEEGLAHPAKRFGGIILVGICFGSDADRRKVRNVTRAAEPLAVALAASTGRHFTELRGDVFGPLFCGQPFGVIGFSEPMEAEPEFIGCSHGLNPFCGIRAVVQ